jgi:hypothetical protein
MASKSPVALRSRLGTERVLPSRDREGVGALVFQSRTNVFKGAY